MTAYRIGQVVDVDVPDSGQAFGLPAEVTGLLGEISPGPDRVDWATVQVTAPAKFEDFILKVPLLCVRPHEAVAEHPRCRGTVVPTGGPRQGPRLYTHDDFDRETLAARGEALPFAPRSERQWAYVLLMAQHVEWVEIDAPGTPAPVRIVVRFDDDAPADDPLAEIALLVEKHRTAGEAWEVSTFVPGLNRR